MLVISPSGAVVPGLMKKDLISPAYEEVAIRA